MVVVSDHEQFVVQSAPNTINNGAQPTTFQLVDSASLKVLASFTTPPEETGGLAAVLDSQTFLTARYDNSGLQVKKWDFKKGSGEAVKTCPDLSDKAVVGPGGLLAFVSHPCVTLARLKP